MEIDIDDFSLEELQKQFTQAQEQSTQHRLSELNVIELVNYLIRSKRLENVVFTMDGREYVTEKQLDREVMDQILVHGGRIHQTDLPELLNIDFGHIEQSCRRLLLRMNSGRADDEVETCNNDDTSENRRLYLVQGELLTGQYLNAVCQEVNETLQESGVLFLSDLTKQLVLPSEFIVSVVSKHITNGKIEGRLGDDTLYTQNYVRRLKAKVRGALLALTRPTPLIQVKSEGIQDSLFDTITKELVKERRVFGTVHRGIFVPKAYEAAMERAVLAFFLQNGYIGYHRVESMTYFKSGANATKNYIKEKLPDAIFVSTGVVSPSLCDTLDASIDEAISNNTPLDLMTVVPSQLEKEDIRQLLVLCPSIEKHRQHMKRDPFILLNGSYLITVQNIDDIVSSFAERANNDVKIFMASQTKKLLTTNANDDDYHSSDEEATKSSKNKKSKSAPKKKGNKRVGKTSKKTAGDDEEDQSKFTKHQDKALLSLVPNKKEIIDHVQKVLKDDGPSQYDDEVDEIFDALINYIMPLLQSMYIKCRDSVFMDATSDRRKQHVDFEKKAQDLYFEVLLHFKAINALIAERSEQRKVDENSLKYQLEKYLMKTKCVQLAYVIAENQALHQQITFDETVLTQISSEADVDEDKLSHEMISIIKSIAQQLPEENERVISALHSSLMGNVDGFLERLSETTDHFNIFLRKLDKKKEKEFLNNRKQELKNMVLPRLIGPAKQLLGICTYIFLTKANLLVHAPGKVMPQLTTYLNQHVLIEEEEMQNLLKRAQHHVPKYLQIKRLSSQALFDEQEELDNILRQLMEKLGIQS